MVAAHVPIQSILSIRYTTSPLVSRRRASDLPHPLVRAGASLCMHACFCVHRAVQKTVLRTALLFNVTLVSGARVGRWAARAAAGRHQHLHAPLSSGGRVAAVWMN